MTTLRAGMMAGLALAVMLAPAQGTRAETLANRLFGARQTAAEGRAEAIGTYARGCARGLVQLPETGPTWQAMRLSRNRNWAHPEMVDYLQALSRAARQLGWAGLYVGDISQPRGGPMTSGHASHQIGLDADVWMLPPRSLTLTRQQREDISSVPVRSADQRSVTGNWTPAHRALMRAAALDKRVDRIFVAAAVKIEMCRTATRKDRAWLQKIRPIQGHEAHFHVRLKCPDGSAACRPQTPTVAELSKGGDGCDASLTWWVTDYLDPPKGATQPEPEPDAPRARTAREFTMADLPRACGAVLAAD